MTVSWVPPAFIFLLGALVIPFLRSRALKAATLLVPVVAFVNLLGMPEGTAYVVGFLDYELVFGRVDRLSMVFAYVFVIMTFAGAIFALHLDDRAQHSAAFAYVGGSLGVVFSGDLLTLFIFWELMALSSVYLIWARGTQASWAAGMRYILVHLAGGLLLFAGIVMHATATGSLEFTSLGLGGPASWLILLGFALNAAIPPLSAWLSDAYPEATVTGTVFLSAFTTKTAVYVLMRSFPGAEVLIWAGVVMAIYGIVYAMLENDIRRILAYSIINQVGFMVAGIGIGTELSLNGSASHAFASVLYTALLMMSAGAVLHMTGRSKCTELGGLYRTMPVTMLFFLVGAASISAFPLTVGFISKSMVIDAAGKGHLTVLWHLLTLASAGGFLYAGMKLPWFVFFGKDSGLRPKEPPLNMLVGMGFLAFLSIFIGVYPEALYRILPYQVDFIPYTQSHVLSQLQILLISALAFFVLLGYLRRTNTINLDTDWFYRKGARAFLWVISVPGAAVGAALNKIFLSSIPGGLTWFSKNPTVALTILWDYVVASMSPPGRRAELREKIKSELQTYPGEVVWNWAVGTTVIWIALFLLAYLLVYYIH